MFWRKRPFDRTELLAAADRARARGRTKKAIAGYRKVLETVPGDLAVHAKIAPLLARTGQREASLASFRLPADGQEAAGFPDRGLSLVVQAAGFYPEELHLWEEIARLHLARARRADAVAALVAGGRRLFHLRALEVGAQVLRRAVEIETFDVAFHIIGGGAQNRFLNACIANACGVDVYAGPVEATAIGNATVQAMAAGVFPDLLSARQSIAISFPPEIYRPTEPAIWNEHQSEFKDLTTDQRR